MSNLNRFGWLLAALLVSFASYAGDIEISGVWTRATAPGQDQAGMDLSIQPRSRGHARDQLAQLAGGEDQRFLRALMALGIRARTRSGTSRTSTTTGRVSRRG